MAGMQDKTFYEILGVPENAPVDEIKKRYRELARKYHPDVAQDKELASQIFNLVTEAYKTLSDDDSRKTYDAEQLLKKRRVQEKSRPRASATQSASASPAPRTAAQSALVEAERLITQAQAAFVRNKMIEARSLADQALRYNKRSAPAYEVLGDVSRVQGKVDEAIGHYTMALQLDPRNQAVRQRMERMARAATPRPTAPTPRRAAARPSGPLNAVPEHKRPVAQLLLGLIGYAAVVGLLLFGALAGGGWKSLKLPLVDEWSAPLIAILVLCGLILGATMAITQSIRRIEDDFLLRSGKGGSPIGVMTILVGALCFWVAGLVHLAVSTVQESFTPSLLRVYGALAATTILASMAFSGGVSAWQTLLFGGNVLFLAYLLGWYLGDFFRE